MTIPEIPVPVMTSPTAMVPTLLFKTRAVLPVEVTTSAEELTGQTTLVIVSSRDNTSGSLMA